MIIREAVVTGGNTSWRLIQSKIKLASQDLRKRWKMKQEKLSPNYTCKVNDIIKVK